MATTPRVLVVAATAKELTAGDGWGGALCGVGPVEAAVNGARAIAEYRPDAVLQVGIAGARRSAAMAPGTLVIGSASYYADLGPLPSAWAVRQIDTTPALLQAVSTAFPAARVSPIATTSRVDGTHEDEVEAMEGFGVLRAAQAAGIPAIEVRAISNEIEEADRTRWYFDLAFRTITDATPALVQAVAHYIAARPHA